MRCSKYGVDNPGGMKFCGQRRHAPVRQPLTANGRGGYSDATLDYQPGKLDYASEEVRDFTSGESYGNGRQ